MEQIGVTSLCIGFLGLTEEQLKQANPFNGANLLMIGCSKLDATMIGVTYALSQKQSFFLIFDSDYGRTAVVQKTYWGEDTDMLYDMLKEGAIKDRTYPGSDGFFIFTPQFGYILIERQSMGGKKCISASLECIL